jgi:hypothetical protein
MMTRMLFSWVDEVVLLYPGKRMCDCLLPKIKKDLFSSVPAETPH